MEQENFEAQTNETEIQQSRLTQVTPLSKYLAMILFILMPFIGGWIGYTYAPEKVVEVEKIIGVVSPVSEIENKNDNVEDGVNISQENGDTKEGTSPISIVLPENNAEWEIGSSYKIQWTDSMGVSEDGKYHVHLFTEAGERKSISIGKWGDNELYYTVSNLVATPPGTYTLKVCAHPVCDEGAISNGVTIHIIDEGGTDSSITVITPKGEEVWKKGDTKIIQWVDSENIPNESKYSIQVTDKNGNAYGTLVDTIVGTSWPWFNVGVVKDGGELPELRSGEVAYYIKVTDKSNPNNHSLINSPLSAFVLTD